MPKINLLPSDIIPKSSVVKSTKTLTQVVIVGFVLLSCSTVFLIVLFVLNLVKLGSLEKSKTQLLESIKNNQQVEQRLFLVRDRLDKIKTIQSQKSCAPVITEVPSILAQLPASVVLTSATFLPTASEIVFTTGDSAEVGRLMATVIASKAYNAINLKSFTYSELKGYSVGFELIQ